MNIVAFSLSSVVVCNQEFDVQHFHENDHDHATNETKLSHFHFRVACLKKTSKLFTEQ